MKKRKIGNLTVSEIGMGCMGFSHGYGKVPETSYSIAAIRAAHDYGCTFFDTAETYGREQFYPGHNEEIVGRTVEGFRKDIVLATKLHISTEEYDPEGDIYNVLLRHLTASMRRLRTDYVDLYYLHRFNEAIPIEKIAESMGRLIREGKIRGWGLSQVDVSILSKAHEITPVTAVQNLYSMVERDCEKEIFPYCIEHHIGVVPFSPLASGLLSGKVTAETKFGTDDVRKFVPQLSKENLEGNRPIVELLEEFAKVKNPRPRRFPSHGCSINTPTSSRSRDPRTKKESSKTSKPPKSPSPRPNSLALKKPLAPWKSTATEASTNPSSTSSPATG